MEQRQFYYNIVFYYKIKKMHSLLHFLPGLDVLSILNVKYSDQSK